MTTLHHRVRLNVCRQFLHLPRRYHDLPSPITSLFIPMFATHRPNPPSGILCSWPPHTHQHTYLLNTMPAHCTVAPPLVSKSNTYPKTNRRSPKAYPVRAKNEPRAQASSPSNHTPASFRSEK